MQHGTPAWQKMLKEDCMITTEVKTDLQRDIFPGKLFTPNNILIGQQQECVRNI